ncbi:MFS transporter [Gordonia sp. SID5947]|uniref:MFS transporter n=1 Tax=Gordonia sp. SID5947 TaxID=2690315 RepID=UPI00136F15FC|nr:MFS transporter [Gordonia sp. SID5947]MYR07980.1 MFS transporter [Gordonia sp. SID5947]
MTEVARPEQECEKPTERDNWSVVALVSLAAVMAGLSLTGLSTALPAVVRYFGAGSAAATWTVLGPIMTSTSLMLVCGRISDRVGRRGMFLLSMALFTMTSLAQGFAHSIEVLVGLRLLQAVATAMLVSNSAAIVGSVLSARSLGLGMGVYLACWTGAELVGPTIGGLITTAFGWQWVFWANVPAAAICLMVAFPILHLPRGPAQKRSFDIPGTMLFVVAICGLVTALSEGNGRGWSDPVVMCAVVVFAVAGVFFVVWERRAEDPILNLGVFRSRTFSLANLAGMAAVGSVSAVVIALSLYFQVLEGMSPLHAGMSVLPLAVGTLAGSLLVGFLTRRWWADVIAIWACGATALGLVAVLAAIATDQPAAVVGLCTFMVGLGSGAFLPANVTIILARADPGQLGSLNAIRLTLQNIAYLLGSAIGLVALTASLGAGARDAFFAGVPQDRGGSTGAQLVDAYVGGFGVMAGISVLALMLSVFASRARRVSVDR